ncbi:MAG: hypothetical protein AAGK14_04025 [Verrucomicrobiota bacterium]
MSLRVFPEYGEQYVRDRCAWWFCAQFGAEAVCSLIETVVIIWTGWSGLGIVYTWSDLIDYGSLQLSLVVVGALLAVLTVSPWRVAWLVTYLFLLLGLFISYFELIALFWFPDVDDLHRVYPWLPFWVEYLFMFHLAVLYTLIALWWRRRRVMHGYGKKASAAAGTAAA